MSGQTMAGAESENKRYNEKIKMGEYDDQFCRVRCTTANVGDRIRK